MPESPYTKHRELQYRGPSTSDDYNARVEENYKDLVIVKNWARVTQADMDEGYGRLAKDQYSLARALAALDARVDLLEGGSNTLTFYSSDQIDNDRFNGKPDEISEVDRLSGDARYGVLTLPKVETSSLSKLAFVDTEGQTILPSTLETRVVGVAGSADGVGATIDTSEPELAIARSAGRIWERNVVVNSPVAGGATMYLYVKAPTDLFTVDKSNAIIIHPFPTFATDILEVAYTSSVDVTMQDGDGYTVINSLAEHNGVAGAVGWIPPGGWNGDIILDSGPKAFYFSPRVITGLRIKLRQRNYYRENGKYIYSYGLSHLDLRYEKFLASGRAMIRFDAPAGDTISNVTSVQPRLWNIAEVEAPAAFSYRVLYETSPNSGVYTETPVALSSKVWVEVTLNTTTTGASPALSSLSITYT